MKILLSAAAALALLAGAAQAQDKIVRIGTEGAYPPFNGTNAKGEVEGFEIELGNELCKRMNVKCEWVVQDWDGIIPALQAKKFDVIMASMSINEKRKAMVDFSDRYYHTPARLVAKAGSKLEATAASLKGKTVCVQSSTIHADYAEKYWKAGSKIKTYPKQDDANLDLAAGRCQAILADSAVMLDWLKTQKGKYDFVSEPIRDPIFGDGVGAAVRKGDDELRTAINAAIKAVDADGTYKKLNDKYFPFSIR